MADGDLQSLGQVLRQAREARALALDEVERQTRIRVKYLEALESGDLSVLPSATHAKGFLRNYAQFLRLDANALVADFSALTGAGFAPVTTLTASPSYTPPPRITERGTDEEYSPNGAPLLPTERAPQTQQVARSTYVSPRDRVGPAVPRGSVRGAAPVYQPPQADEAPERTSRLKGAPGRILRSTYFVIAVLALGFAGIIWWSSTKLSQVSIDGLVPTQAQAGFLENITGTPPEATGTFEPTSTLPPDSGPQILDRVLLSIDVKQRSWVRISVDDEVQFQGQVEPGDVLQYQGQQLIVVLAGNGAGLDVTYNGQSIGPLGERGEVVERFFTVGEIATPTVTPTITPTNTSVPSSTPRVSPTPGNDS